MNHAHFLGAAVCAASAFSIGIAPVAAAVAPAASCPALRWTTLGTAGGPVPTPERTEPANLLTIASQHILVDTGDGAADQLAKSGYSLGQIDTVFISHNHWDHIGGLSAVIGLRWMNQFPGVLTIYGPVGTRAVVDGIVASLSTPAAIGFGLGTATPAPTKSVRVIEVRSGQTLDLGQGASVMAIENTHFAHPGPPDTANASLSYRFFMGKRSITYTGDTGPSDAVTALAKGSNLLVSEIIDLDALLVEIRKDRPDASPAMLDDMQTHLSSHHLKPEAIGEMASTAHVGRVILTHFAVPPGPVSRFEPGIREGIARSYAGPVELARDLDSFDVGCL